MKELIYTAHKVVASASFVHGGATKTFTYNYLAGTNLLESLVCPSNLTIMHSYEAERDLLAGITIRRGASTDVVLRNYTYDALGRPLTRSTSRNGTTQNDNFGYNSRSELTSATLGNDEYAYAFDHIGNRATETVAMANSESRISNYVTNNLNQYTEISLGEAAASPLQYDADGNMTSVQTSTGTWSITYNGENRPVRFENAATQTVVDCAYDSQGRRFEKKVAVAGATTLHHRYIYRGYLQVAALDLTRSAHPALWFVTWDPSQPVATRPLAIQKDGSWFTYGYDLTKNICEVFGPAGYIRTAYAYAPFGAVTASDNSVVQPFQWSSEVYDSELDLVYYNYRHYSPSLGRFLSRDPIEEQGGLNLYAFVGNNGLKKTDALGLFIVIFAKELLIDVGKEVVLATLKRGFGYIIHVGNLTTALRSACIDKRAGNKMWTSVELTAGSLEIQEELKLKMGAITFDAAIGALWQKSVLSKNFRKIYKGKLDSLARELGYEKFDQKIANVLEGVVVGDVSEKIRNGISKEIGAPSVSMKVRVTKIDKRNRKITYRMKVGAAMTIFRERISVEDAEKKETISPNIQLNQPCFCGN